MATSAAAEPDPARKEAMADFSWRWRALSADGKVLSGIDQTGGG